MKVALGMHTRKSSFGGGNQFGNALMSYLEGKGVEVSSSLEDPDIDVILMTEPRTWLDSSSFGPLEIETYLRKVNPNALVFHRINECDERKGTHTVNKLLENANKMVDHTIYIASWLKPLFSEQGLRFSKADSVILNGADVDIFYFKKKELPENGPIKIVTHHWSPHRFKGWDVYEFLDRALDEDKYDNVEFHYVGNPPQDQQFNNIIFHEPCAGKDLAEILHQCHIYLSASLNEPAGMHHIEGACCGLPLVYRKSGALPEYCHNHGEEFSNQEDVLDALDKVLENYESYAEKMRSYPNTADKMCSQYHHLFSEGLDNKEKVLKERGSSFTGPLKRWGLKSVIFTQRLKGKFFD